MAMRHSPRPAPPWLGAGHAASAAQVSHGPSTFVAQRRALSPPPVRLPGAPVVSGVVMESRPAVARTSTTASVAGTRNFQCCQASALVDASVPMSSMPAAEAKNCVCSQSLPAQSNIAVARPRPSVSTSSYGSATPTVPFQNGLVRALSPSATPSHPFYGTVTPSAPLQSAVVRAVSPTATPSYPSYGTVTPSAPPQGAMLRTTSPCATPSYPSYGTATPSAPTQGAVLRAVSPTGTQLHGFALSAALQGTARLRHSVSPPPDAEGQSAAVSAGSSVSATHGGTERPRARLRLSDSCGFSASSAVTATSGAAPDDLSSGASGSTPALLKPKWQWGQGSGAGNGMNGEPTLSQLCMRAFGKTAQAVGAPHEEPSNQVPQLPLRNDASDSRAAENSTGRPSSARGAKGASTPRGSDCGSPRRRGEEGNPFSSFEFSVKRPVSIFTDEPYVDMLKEQGADGWFAQQMRSPSRANSAERTSSPSGQRPAARPPVPRSLSPGCRSGGKADRPPLLPGATSARDRLTTTETESSKLKRRGVESPERPRVNLNDFVSDWFDSLRPNLRTPSRPSTPLTSRPSSPLPDKGTCSTGAPVLSVAARQIRCPQAEAEIAENIAERPYACDLVAGQRIQSGVSAEAGSATMPPPGAPCLARMAWDPSHDSKVGRVLGGARVGSPPKGRPAPVAAG